MHNTNLTDALLMSKKFFLITFLAVLLTACSEPGKKQTNTLLVNSKKLEYSRISDPAAWATVFKLAKTQHDTMEIIKSLSHVHDPALLPLLETLIREERQDSVLISLISAVGLIGHKNSEILLMKIPYSEYSPDVRRAIIKALAHCCSEKSVGFLSNLLNDPNLRSEVLQSLAICARKEFVDYETIQKVKNSSPIVDRPLAYFFYNSRSLADAAYYVNRLDSTASPIAKKYLLKALYTLHQKKPAFFVDLIQPDSVLFARIKNSLVSTLKSAGQPWQSKYYALHLSGAFFDSLHVDLVKSFVDHENPHLKIAATRALVKIDSAHGELFLLSKIGELQNVYLKGVLIKILAEQNPPIAYRFIMENLDKGNQYFKGLLLEALAQTKSKYAFKTLRQFLSVDNDYLRNKAFDLLNNLNKIRNKDAALLLQSDAVSSFSMAMEWINKHRRKQPLEFLIDKYRLFSFIDGFEAQRQILRSLELFHPQIEPADFDSLYTHASIYQIKRKLRERYPALAKQYSVSEQPLFTMPEYLGIDSLLTIGSHPVVALKTEKGLLKIELYPEEAPLTVKNFLSLARKGFYDNLSFHRVVADFVIQGGDPLGDGWGGPGYVIPSEDNLLPYERGSVGIATSGYDTGGCQFFICQSEQPHLTGNYTLFGKVIENIDIIDSILPGDKILGIEIVK